MENRIHIKITETEEFRKEANYYLKKRRLCFEDINDLRRILAANPELGDLIPKTGGIRKIRLKSIGTGTRGGFRVCYYYLVGSEIFLIAIFHKTEQENLSNDEIVALKNISSAIKKRERSHE